MSLSKGASMRSPGSPWALNKMSSVLIRGRQEDDQRDTGREAETKWHVCKPRNARMMEATRSQDTAWGQIRPQPRRQLDFGLLNDDREISVVLSH